MRIPIKIIALSAALIIAALPALSMNALAKDHDRDWGDRDNDRGDRGHVSGVPGDWQARASVHRSRLWHLLAGSSPPQLAVILSKMWVAQHASLAAFVVPATRERRDKAHCERRGAANIPSCRTCCAPGFGLVGAM